MPNDLDPALERATLLASLIAVALSVLTLGMQFDPSYQDTDTSQYLSAARNMLDGGGFSTSVIAFEQQIGHLEMPAPQTVFPPGLSWLLAGLLALGAAPDVALLEVGLAAYALIGLVTGMSLRFIGVSHGSAFLGVLLWLGLASAWTGVLQGRSELPFTLATLLATLVLALSNGSRLRLSIAGLVAASALAIRYQGVFFIAALAIWCAWNWLAAPPDERPSRIGDAAALLVLPVVFAALLFGRNLLLTGSAFGGPLDTVDWNPATGLDFLRSAYWALIPFTGLSLDGLAELRWQEVTFAVGIVALGVWFLVRRFAARADLTRISVAPARQAVLRLGVTYVAATIIAFAYLASRSDAYMHGRFFVAIVPFCILLWIAWLDRLLSDEKGGRRAAGVGILLVLHVAWFGAQSSVLQGNLFQLRANKRVQLVDLALAEPFGGGTLGGWLLGQVTNDAPILATGGNTLWRLIERPVVETPAANYSMRDWNDAEVMRLAHCFGIRYLLYIPGLFDPALRENGNQHVYLRLSRDDTPGFLAPLLRTPHAHLYEFRASEPDRGNFQ